MGDVIIPKQHQVTVRAEGRRVLLVIDGRAITLPPKAARIVGRALLAKAGLAEEVEQHERIVRDGAILARIGAPIGLTSHPKLLEEVGKAAQFDRDLRRYLPGGVKSKGIVGAPTICVHPKEQKP